MTIHTHIVEENKHREFLKEERHDPFTQERIKPGDEVVFCAKCQCAFLLDSWKTMAEANSCIFNHNNCNHTQTLRKFPQTRREPLQFKKSSTLSNLPSHKKSYNRPTLFSTRNIVASLFALVVIIGLIITIPKVLHNTPAKSQGEHPENVSRTEEGETDISQENRAKNPHVDKKDTELGVQRDAFRLESDSWRDSFYKYSSTQKITAPVGFVVKSAHYLQANTLKEVSTFTVIEAAGYLETNEGRFYMSPWSLERALKGHKPNWVWIKTRGKGDWENKAENTEEKSDYWRESFYKYSSTQNMTAPIGFVVKSDHYLQAKTLKEISTSTVIEVAGYLETDEGRFYMSPWSWERTLNGHRPNWIWIK